VGGIKAAVEELLVGVVAEVVAAENVQVGVTEDDVDTSKSSKCTPDSWHLPGRRRHRTKCPNASRYGMQDIRGIFILCGMNKTGDTTGHIMLVCAFASMEANCPAYYYDRGTRLGLL
jgi:hypothetical protein